MWTPLLLAGLTSAQAAPTAVSVGLTAPYGVWPGVAVSAEIALTEGLYLSPRVSGFASPLTHRSALTQLDLGWRTRTGARGWSGALSAGLGYRLESQLRGIEVDLATGEQSSTRALRHSLLPAASVEATRALGDRVAAYGRFSSGLELGIGTHDAVFFGLEAGLRFGGGIR